MPAAVEVVHRELKPNARAALSAPCVPEPSRAGLESWRLARRSQAVVQLAWRLAVESHVGPVLVVPARLARELAAHLLQPEGHEDTPRAL